MSFFTKGETESKSHPSGKVQSCSACGLYRDVTSPRMVPFGNFQKGILNVGEAPGATEDKTGRHWQGKVGKRLQRAYKGLGIDLFEDCLNINAINCRPTDEKGKNRPPTPTEIACCRKRVLKTIHENQPKVIMVLGNSAVSSLLGHRWGSNLGGITKWRGWTIPDRDFNAWVCPTFHPSFVDRDQKTKLTETIWLQDLERALGMTKEPFPKYKDEAGQVEIIDDLIVFRELGKLPDVIGIDYETTGLRPHAKGHRIVAASIATSPDHAYAFMMPKTRRQRQIFIDILTNKRIGKIGFNIKFEERWSVVRLGCSVENWQWDGMQAAHILDNRAGISGLKFQTYVNFGVIDYSSEVIPFLKSKEKKNANAFNRIMELVKGPGGIRKLLTYGGMDSIFEYKLAQKQMSEILF